MNILRKFSEGAVFERRQFKYILEYKAVYFCSILALQRVYGPCMRRHIYVCYRNRAIRNFIQLAVLYISIEQLSLCMAVTPPL